MMWYLIESFNKNPKKNKKFNIRTCRCWGIEKMFNKNPKKKHLTFKLVYAVV